MVTIRIWLVALAMAAQTDAVTHKTWMNDAADAQDELKEALFANALDKASAPATKIADLMARTEQYWTVKHMDDVVRVAEESQMLAKQVAAAAKRRI
jgi:hypothetical protein